MTVLLAVDAGGTSTRAVALDSSASVLGFGRAGGGNPTSRGIDLAVRAIAEAAAAAGAGVAPDPDSAVTIAMAGQQTEAFRIQVGAHLDRLGWRRVILQHDLLGVFGSGTWELDGYALIAGTGSVAARITGGEPVQVVGGRGWLLGDAGSGFWIGHRVARAVIADLDGQGEPTLLTELASQATGGPPPGPSPSSRREALLRLMTAWYAQPPVQLAALAPLAFAAPQDPTARAILVAASRALADLVAAVRVPELAGPVVVGGSVAVQGLLAAGPDLRRDLVPIGGDAAVVPVTDGVLGAAVLALREAGVEVDQPRFERLRAGVEAVRTP